MNAVLYAFLFLAAALIGFTVWFLIGEQTAGKRKRSEAESQRQQDYDSIKQLQERALALQRDLEKARTDYANILRGLDDARRKEQDALHEAARFKSIAERVGPIEEENRNMLGRVNQLESLILTHKKEIESRDVIIADLSTKLARGQGVSLEEHELAKQELVKATAEAVQSRQAEHQAAALVQALRQDLADKEARLAQLVKDSASAQEHTALKAELQEKEQALQEALFKRSAAQQDYDNLKKKLEEAESVLRLLHGAQ